MLIPTPAQESRIIGEDEESPLVQLNDEEHEELMRYSPIYQLEDEIMKLLQSELDKIEGTLLVSRSCSESLS